MTTAEALLFLEEHQPLPQQMSPTLTVRFEAALASLRKNPHTDCIPLLLGCFANWEEIDHQESIQALLQQFPTQQVIPHLAQSLASEDVMVRKWSADTARIFPHEDLLPLLSPLLVNEDTEIRLISAAALECIGGARARAIAQRAMAREQDEQILDILAHVGVA